MDHGRAGVSIFLKLDNGKIAGESLNANHKGEIELLSMGFGGSNSATTHLGGADGGGIANVNDIKLFKYNDKSTPELIHRVMTGQPIGEAQIAFVEPDLKTGGHLFPQKHPRDLARQWWQRRRGPADRAMLKCPMLKCQSESVKV